MYPNWDTLCAKICLRRLPSTGVWKASPKRPMRRRGSFSEAPPDMSGKLLQSVSRRIWILLSLSPVGPTGVARRKRQMGPLKTGFHAAIENVFSLRSATYLADILTGNPFTDGFFGENRTREISSSQRLRWLLEIYPCFFGFLVLQNFIWSRAQKKKIGLQQLFRTIWHGQNFLD